MRTPTKKIRIGEILLEEGLISQDQLQKALVDQLESGQALGEMLVSQGVISGSVLMRVLAARLGVRGGAHKTRPQRDRMGRIRPSAFTNSYVAGGGRSTRRT